MARSTLLRSLIDEVRSLGLLLESDGELPSVVEFIVGAPVHGSWWGHPRGGGIYNLLQDLADDPDIMVVKLVRGKVTFVHRSLWPALRAMGTSRQPWQMDRLSDDARDLLELVRERGTVRADLLAAEREVPYRTIADAARVLEQKLLAVGGQIHTESGAHAKILESWERWGAGVGLGASDIDVEEARAALEEATARLCGTITPKGKLLPWSRPRKS
jgi:hypothetical protein